ncbi:g1157 [Coccomyxa elongata]
MSSSVLPFLTSRSQGLLRQGSSVISSRCFHHSRLAPSLRYQRSNVRQLPSQNARHSTPQYRCCAAYHKDRWTHSASSSAQSHSKLPHPHAWRWQEGTASDAASSSATAGAAAPFLERWQSRVASFLVAAGLALALVLGSSPAAFASVFPLVETPTSPATLEMKAPDINKSELSAEEMQTVQLFLDSTPSVVNIANIAERTNFRTMDTMQVPQGTGSGFIWDKKGHVVTNFHVIRGASDIKVALIDSSVYPAKVIGGDPDKDIAVLQLQAPEEKLRELRPITLGTSTNLLVGQKVYAIGNPFGLDHTLTQGIVSGLGRELATPGFRGVPIKNVIQTDAAINPGNSGGVLLNSKGRLIGINTAIADPTGKGANSGVGFAIPIDGAKGLVEQILQYGKVVRPILGITIAPPQTVRQMGVEGVLILEVPPGGPAANAGLRGTYRDELGRVVLGDVITGIDGREIKLQRELFEILDEKRPGDRIKVEVLRGGDKVTFNVTLGGRDVVGTE